MTDISELVYEYKKTKGWKKEKELVDITKKAISLLINGILENYDEIGTDKFITIFKLCQNNDATPADEKKESVENLEIEEEKNEEIKSLIEQKVGVVGDAPHLRFNLMEIPPEKEKDVYKFIKAINENEDKEVLDEAINNFADLDIDQIQSGTISPILYFLHPKKFPVINNKSRDYMKKYFDMKISRQLTEYIAETEKYKNIREKYDFDKNYRDLDKFMTWLAEDMEEEINTWQIGVGHIENKKEMWNIFLEENLAAAGFHGLNYTNLSKKQIEEKRKKNDIDTSDVKKRMIYKFYNKIKKGDVVIAKTKGSNPFGIGVVTKEAYYDKDKSQDLFPPKTNRYSSFINVDWVIDFVGINKGKRPELDLEDGFKRGTLYKYSHFDKLKDESTNKFPLEDEFFEIELLSKKLKLQPKTPKKVKLEREIWFEKTERRNKSSEIGWGLGECLASPQRDSRGADIYQYMRDCRRGDVVIHYLQDEDKLVGISKVSGPYEEVENPPRDKDSRWAGRPYYRVPLENYKKLDSPILRREILENDDYEDILHRIRERAEEENIQIFYNTNLDLRQGGYLTKVPQTLMKIFTEQSSELEEYVDDNTDYPIENLERIDLELPKESLEEDEEIDISKKLDYTISDDTLDPLHFPGKPSPKMIVSQISAALNAGKHIIITGPPGTGKTEVARLVCRELYKNNDDLYTGFHLTTATADWSTFDTVGGYMPSKEGDSKLKFKSGQILRRFKDPEEDGSQKNDLLIIDEINRADIDKAFGPLFTLLSGQKVQLPFQEDKKEIEIIPYNDSMDEIPTQDETKYIVPKSWRIIATMNSYDKTSLYEMSYAFMRRFQFIRIGVPEIPDPDDSPDETKDMMKGYLDCWEDIGLDADDDYEDVSKLVKIWHQANAEEGRKIGPAIVKDMLGYLDKTRDSEDGGVPEEEFTEAVIGYILPQLEGVPEASDIIENIKGVGVIDWDELKEAAYEMLQVDLGEEDG